METPKTLAGDLTERIMAAIRAKFPDMPTWEYNETYSAVLTTLTDAREISEIDPNCDSRLFDACRDVIASRRQSQRR